MSRIAIYDTTLRDGAQGQGISFSPVGKLRVAKRLDEFGVEHAAREAVDLDAGGDQCVERALPGMTGQDGVDALRHDQTHAHTPMRRVDEGELNGLVRHEIELAGGLFLTEEMHICRL